ncbi:efflux transporter outer membrane subunit [Variovorax sp. OV329]|uniref:efflux transporter outer membrane subunit n=1 Tax=Variovorax sp. OV329 TaxID=1882825 RepID=UPI0008F26CC4|nr:efflux transporter outer membrane subunit [Variovorax sp. OV329]SFL91928.1 efflux transporter, outer membrane factor (OMF) lipoprotein, NodT family [Variovorax sp. OV329]
MNYIKRHPDRSNPRSALAVAVLLALAACAQLPDRTATPRMQPAEHYASAQSFAAPESAAWPGDGWWKAYGDPQLDELVDEALAQAPTLAVAQARLRRADAATQLADAALLPQVTANVSASEKKQSYNDLIPRAAVPKGFNSYGHASLDFSWEIDFFGRNQAALAAATSDARAAQADLAQARLVLAASVAAAYAELARLFAAQDAAESAFVVRGKTAELFRRRHDNGLETLGSVRQVEARHAASEADLLLLKEQVALQRNRIAALLGAGPDRGLSMGRPASDILRPFALPAHLAADLLGRRPDVQAARLRAQASASRIKESEAAFYPNVNLLAFVGVQSLGLGQLTKGGSGIAGIGPAVTLPIFDGGRLRAQLRGADAEYAQAAAQYDGAVVQALQEVADAVTSQRALGGQIRRIDDAVDAAREAWRIQNRRYEGGLSDYLDVLSAEDGLLANLRTQSDLRSRSFSLDVALVRALGGGYDAAAASPH